MAIQVGNSAPDFTLKDNRGNDAKLSDYKGKKVLLSFHPLAWTGVCADQMKALEEKKDIFAGLNTVALGISVDSVPSKNAWAKELGIEETKLLSDFWPHGEVAQKYDVFLTEKGFSQRINIILDEDGKVIWVKNYDIPVLPDIEEVIASLQLK